MKFIVSSNTLLKNVNLIGGVINSNNTLPILDNFLFELDGSQLTITGSDLETTISTTLEVESNDNGKIAIPSKILTDTLKTFPAQPLTFIQKEGNTLEIVSEQGNYQLAFEDANEYPQTQTSKMQVLQLWVQVFYQRQLSKQFLRQETTNYVLL